MLTLDESVEVDLSKKVEHQITLQFCENGEIQLIATSDDITECLSLIHTAYVALLNSFNQTRPTLLS